jgi:G6PDH family F420-dependent oxidoreductase
VARITGHAPYAWSVLGAAAQATHRIPLMTYVTCPIRRYHPAVVAQKAATMQLLSDGRFTLGLGAGENLNEHIVGGGWPIVAERHEMLEEAVEIIRSLWSGDTVTFRGKYFTVESAKVWDLPERVPPIGIAASGPASCRLAGRHADIMIGVEPRPELGEMFDNAGGAGKPRVGQLAVSYDPDEGAAMKRALDQFRWFTANWKVNAELPMPASFDGASTSVREEDIASKMPCGPDVARHVAAIRKFEEAGYTHVALVQVGGQTQEQFIAWAATELMPALAATA